MYLNVTVVHQKWYHLSLVDPDLMVCRLLNVNIDMFQGTSSKLSTQVLVNEKNRIRQQAKSQSQMMFVWWCTDYMVYELLLQYNFWIKWH